MEIILAFIILLQFGYTVFRDIKSGQEREDMLLKLMSKDLSEYKLAKEDISNESAKSEEVIRIPIEEASLEQILKAEQ